MQLLEKYPARRENLLLILHELQDANDQSYLTSEDMQAVAEYLNITFSTVYGVATYYSMLSVKPRGRHVIRVCKSPVCDMFGAPEIIRQLEELLGVTVGETTPDKLFTCEESACLGRCDSAVSMMIDGQYYGSLDKQTLSTIIERYRRE